MSNLINAVPEAKVALTEDEPDRLVSKLLERELDLILVYHYDLVPPQWPAADLHTTTVLSEELTLTLPSAHKLSDSSVALADLADETWISPQAETAGARALVHACAAAGFTPRVEFFSNDYSVIRGFVRAGLGIALIPALAS